MKKLLLWAAGLLGLFTACQQEELPGMESGSSQTITVSIPEGVQTKATTADFGKGAHINRCILQVYHNNQPYGEQLVAAVNDQKQAIFNLRLVTSQTYDFVFWADCATGTAPTDFTDNHYNTENLTAISVNGAYTGNNDEFDAFTAVQKGYKVEGAFKLDVTLKRPFGQLNVSTSDWDAIQDETLKPNKVKVAFKSVPTTFNALTGVAGENKELTYETALLTPATGALTVDYLFASEREGATLADFTMTFFNGDTEITQNDAFTNIPIRRNYRTNVSGNLLTKQGTLNVAVDPDFEQPDIDWKGDLEHAAQEGGEVTLEENVQLDEPLNVVADKTMYLDLNGQNITNTGNSAAIIVEGELIINSTVSSTNRNVNNLGVINGGTGGNNVAVWVKKGGKLTIHGGIFTVGTDANGQGNTCIYSTGGEVYINGGEFSTEADYNGKYYVLNLQNGSGGKIVCTGGKFKNFNPTNGDDHDQPTSFVAEGYTSVLLDDQAENKIYQVVKNNEIVNVTVGTAEGMKTALSNNTKSHITIAQSIDLSTATCEELTLNEYKSIVIPKAATLKLGNANWITANQGISISGEGTIDNTSENHEGLGNGWQKSLIHVIHGNCNIDGVTLINDMNYHWHGSSANDRPYNSTNIAYWNDANVTITNATLKSGGFTICGMGRNIASGTITLTNSYFESSSSNKDNGEHWAYAMRLYGNKATLENCEVKGIQGGVSIENMKDALIKSGKYYTVNTPGEKDAFYPLYITNGAIVTIEGGEFIGANVHTNLNIEGTSSTVSGDNDANLPTGSIVLKGGKFSGKPYNHVTNTIYEPAQGYQWREITNEEGLKWEVVNSSL